MRTKSSRHGRAACCLSQSQASGSQFWNCARWAQPRPFQPVLALGAPPSSTAICRTVIAR
ncbi:hypothetical protein EMPG_17636 [Blastomyces silverae]|uniref:Uncharacterized protein n=1 Tax=Blastomyces silverae TaxID=2060906 RepID=A0A0H1BCD9_9EURO|nr:hypothetical protein EMPG_17636 [Blastomyces silverae]